MVDVCVRWVERCNQRKWLESEKLLSNLNWCDDAHNADDGIVANFRPKSIPMKGIVFLFMQVFIARPFSSSLSAQIAYCLAFITTSINFIRIRNGRLRNQKSQPQQPCSHKLRPIWRGRLSNKNCLVSIVGSVCVLGDTDSVV